eukprot:jgi/Mesvir1/2563/Mv10308-RA.1
MKLYTRRGDEGRSRINGPGDLHKSEEIFEALGAVDEANSFLGLARQTCKDAALKDDVPVRPQRFAAGVRVRDLHGFHGDFVYVHGGAGDLDPFRYETSDYAGYYGSKDVPAGVFPRCRRRIRRTRRRGAAWI